MRPGLTKNAAFLSSQTAWAAIWRAKWPVRWRLTRCAEWPRGTKTWPVDLLKKTVLGAHERIYLHAQGHAECAGMGTTISMMWRGGYMYIAHVGDSRIYRLRDGHMEQITQDHSLVGELVRAGL